MNDRTARRGRWLRRKRRRRALRKQGRKLPPVPSKRKNPHWKRINHGWYRAGKHLRDLPIAIMKRVVSKQQVLETFEKARQEKQSQSSSKKS